MRKTVGKVILVSIVAAGGVIGWLTRPTTVPLSAGSAVQRGLQYLVSVYTPYHYPDAYLEYVYPGETLTCPLDNCTLTYRILDAFFDVRFLEEELEHPETVRAQILDASRTFAAILPEWRTANLYNTIVGSGKPGLALDTTCILGYAEQDEAIADHVAAFLTDDGDWLRQNEYPVDRWRNIADETWCLRLFAKTKSHADRLPLLVREKIRETDVFLASEQEPGYRIAVLFHMLYLLADYPQNGFQQDRDRFADALAGLANDPVVNGDTFTQANILDALARVQYADHALLKSLAQDILSRQRDDGSWTQTANTAAYPVFTTFRATLALNKYDRLLRGVPVDE